MIKTAPHNKKYMICRMKSNDWREGYETKVTRLRSILIILEGETNEYC